MVNAINGGNPGTPIVRGPPVGAGAGGRRAAHARAERRVAGPRLAHRPVRGRLVPQRRDPGVARLPPCSPSPAGGPSPASSRHRSGARSATSSAWRPWRSASVQGVLLGGYGGGWVSTAEALAMPLTEEAARHRGSSIGAGVVILLPVDVCPLLEVSRVVRYLEGQGAGPVRPLRPRPRRLGLAPWSRWPSSPGRCATASPTSPPCADWSRAGAPVPIPTVWPGSSGPPCGCSRTTPASTSSAARATRRTPRFSLCP